MVSKKGFAIIYLVLIGLLVGAMVLFLLIKTSKLPTTSDQKTESKAQPTNLVNNYKVKGNCSDYGKIEDNSKLYEKYVVKQGDTLLSIASKELKSTSRITDIIYINKNTYPGLSIQKPYIEPGWILYLPPPYFKVIEFSGTEPKLLYGWAGELSNITNEGKWIVTGPQSKDYYGFQPNNETQYFGKEKNKFIVGDCIKVILKGYDQTVFAVYSQ